MKKSSRREFLKQGAVSAAILGFPTLLLSAEVKPTESSGDLGSYGKYLREKEKPPVKPAEKWAPTEDNILGPFYREGAPYRAKITSPLESGTVLLVSGHVWGYDTKKPLVHATLDIWQANARGRYDNDDPKNPPAKDVFKNRARLVTDENGYCEFETIHPAPYKIGPESWRPSHIHYLVQHPGYRTLVTQLYFKGDPHNKTDRFIKESLIIDLKREKAGDAVYERGEFDIVLARE